MRMGYFFGSKTKSRIAIRIPKRVIYICDFKELILSAYREIEDFWDDSGELNESITLIKNAKTHEEIILR